MNHLSRNALGTGVLNSDGGDIPLRVLSKATIEADLEGQDTGGRSRNKLSVSIIGYLSKLCLGGRRHTDLQVILDHYNQLTTIATGCKAGESVAGQFVFLCFHKDGESYAIQIPCYRPRAKRRVVWSRENRKTGIKTCKYKGNLDTEIVNESDSMIYNKLKEACFQHQGNWKRWVPFYGIIVAQEVKIVLISARKTAGPLPVHVYHLDVDDIRRKLNHTTMLQDPEDLCRSKDRHGQSCYFAMLEYGELCIEDQIIKAKERKEYLLDLPLLKEYMQDPWSATAHTKEGRSTLEGLAQESMVINYSKLDNAERTDELPAIEVVLGWQIKRLVSFLPRVWLVLAVIWIVVVISGLLFRDWSLSVGIGQLVAASVGVMFAMVKL